MVYYFAAQSGQLYLTTYLKMKKQRTLLLAFFALLFSTFSFAQTTITGRVTDESTKEPVSFGIVYEKGTTNGAQTDATGNFKLNVDFKDRTSVELELDALGYEKTTVKVQKDNPVVEFKAVSGENVTDKVVVSGSRVSEKLVESPVQIQKMTIKDIEGAASGDFYGQMGQMQGVDINQSSMGFKAVNMRGFNSTAPVRVVQLVDGMDNQAPGLNFAVGNLVGANDLDLQSVEIVTGAASALYGPNAFQGVVSMKTKDPFQFRGADLLIKGGSRNLIDGQFRYADVFGTKQRFAIKLTGSYMRADDWVANDTINRYGDVTTEQDLSAIVAKLPFDQTLTQEERDDFLALNDYLGFNPVGFQGLGKRDIKSPGYMENQLTNNNVYSLKTALEMHYKFNDSLRLIGSARFGMGSAIYQGANRYNIKDITFQQYKLELTGKRLMARVYTTQENAGNSYDVVFTGINIARENIGEYVGEYLSTYFDALDSLTNGFDSDLNLDKVGIATALATAAAEQMWYPAGSTTFDTLRSRIITDGRLSTGSKFIDRSALYNTDIQYDVPTKWKGFQLLVGGSGRIYTPNSEGTIFADTLIDRNNPDGGFVKIRNWEFGGFAQASKRLFKDKLRIIVSLRGDKNQNFDPQFSPRLSAVWNVKGTDHVLRFSAQRAFRMPTLQNQFIFLDLGPITLRGNLTGFDNLYTLSSVQDFREHYDSTFVIDYTKLRPIALQPLKPEEVQTAELGYRGVWFKDLYVDATVFFSNYRNFIGDIRVVEPGNGTAGQQDGDDAILTGNQQVYQIPINATQAVTSVGANIGLTYYINSKYNVGFNYSYNALNTRNLSDDIIPGFNTPRNKINANVRGTNVWKGLGFSVGGQWVESFLWQSPFAIGQVPSFYFVDTQLSYDFKDIGTVLRIGASNTTNFQRREIAGGPTIGRIIYASLQFNLW